MATAPAPASAAGSGGSAKSSSTGAKSTTKTVVKKKVVRKVKRPGSKAGGATATQQALAASRSAQMDLASLRNDAAARRVDPLWYKAEDVLPSVADDTLMSESATKVLPEQIKIVEAALEKNNLARPDVTPQAFACLLEQARRYAMEVLTDSQDYAFVAGRTEIAPADLKLANEFRPDHPMAVSTQIPKLNLLSQTVNRVPLPPIPTQCYSGVLLPPKHHQLTARTFDVVTSAQTARRMVQAAPPPPHKVKTAKKKSDKNRPNYGASKGRQISVKLKTDPAKKDEGKKEPGEKKNEGDAKKEEETPIQEEKPKAAGGADNPTSAVAAAPAPVTGVTSEQAPGNKKDDDDKMDVEKKEMDAAAAGASGTAADSSAPKEAATTEKTTHATAPVGEGGAAPMETSPTK
ncbi:MAG: hypothetical protein SGILL_001350 [Bacillariaceae sp.]